VSINEKTQYCVVQIPEKDGHYIVAEPLVPILCKKLGTELEVKRKLLGECFSHLFFSLPAPPSNLFVRFLLSLYFATVTRIFIARLELSKSSDK